MFTANTMNCMMEALGIALPGDLIVLGRAVFARVGDILGRSLDIDMSLDIEKPERNIKAR